MLHCANLLFILYSIHKAFDVSHFFLPLTITELSTLKQVRVFLAHPVDKLVIL